MSQSNNNDKNDLNLFETRIAVLPDELIGLRLPPLWEIFFALFLGVVFSVVYYFGLFSKLENAMIDFRFNQRGEICRSQDIILVTITDDCIEALGSWPWKRAVHANLLARVSNAGARTVAFDIEFSENSIYGPEDDDIFSKVISGAGRIVLPQVLTKTTVLDPETFSMVERETLQRPAEIYRAPLSVEGFIDVEYMQLNPDGVIREVFLHNNYKDSVIVSFAIAAASDYLGINPVLQPSGISIGNRFLPYHNSYRLSAGKRLNSYMINYAGRTTHFDEISYSDVIAGNYSAQLFSNRLVMVGTRARGISEDVKFCPYGAIAGIEVHANILHNIFNRRVLQRNTVETTITMIILLAFLCGYIMLRSHNFLSNIACLGIPLAWAVISVLLFNLDYVTDMSPIIILLPLQWAITRLVQQFVSLGEKNYQLALKVRELAIINEISQAVSFMGNLKKTVDSILARGVQVLNASHGSLLMLDDKYEQLVEKSYIYGVEKENEISNELRELFKHGKGIAGEVFESGRARLVKNARREKGFTSTSKDLPKLKSLICVPLMIKNTAIGVINIANKKNGKFEQSDLQMAITIANQAAVVIEKARLYNLATIDGLTGLVVHRHFQSKLEEEFKRAKRYKKPLSYLMTDIDHFKNFNDTYGHQIGDVVLREVALCVMECIRDTDLAARYGGEEFAVVLPETELEGAQQMAERLRQKVEETAFETSEGNLHVTISIGVSCIPHNEIESAKQMIQFADEALYVCKRNGRNRVEVYSPKA